MTKSPCLYDFHKMTEYLQALYTHYKKHNEGFSYEAWSLELGYKSRSFLKMVVTGQRSITTDFIQALSASMKFSSEETSYLHLTAQYEQADNEQGKTAYLDKILEHLGQIKGKNLSEVNDEFLKSGDLPKLLMILGFKDVLRTSAGLALLMNLPMEIIEKKLQQLEEMGLARVCDSQWEAYEDSFRVPNKFGNEAISSYHQHSLMEAIEAQKMEARLRRFRSLLLPLGDQDFEILLKDIEALVNKSLAQFDHKSLNDRRLYKMNINVYPVTPLVKSQD